MNAPARKPRRSPGSNRKRGGARGRSSSPSPKIKPQIKLQPARVPADIVGCAKQLGLRAVMLGPDGLFVLAPVARSSGLHFIWRQANDAERRSFEQAAGDRFVAGHWSVRPGAMGISTRTAPARAKAGSLKHGA